MCGQEENITSAATLHAARESRYKSSKYECSYAFHISPSINMKRAATIFIHFYSTVSCPKHD